MATYNGGKYLKEQLDSIINQTATEWELFIHDDGSTDETEDIVLTYCRNNNKIHLLQDEQKHRGAMGSFMWLLAKVEAEYYMFSDQDDVWLPNKIELSLIQLKKVQVDSSTPILIHTDLCIVNSNLEIICDSMWKQSRMNNIVFQPEYLKASSMVAGCTMLFNNAAKSASLIYKHVGFMHDALIALAVYTKSGIISPIPNPTILYRQHEHNVVGFQLVKNIWLYRLKNFRLTLKRNFIYYRFSHKISRVYLHEYIWLKVKMKISQTRYS